MAPNKGEATNLRDIELAVQTEIPLVKQHLSDSFWVIKGQGSYGERYNRLTGETTPIHPRPSRGTTIAVGFGGISRFFQGGRGVLAAMDDDIAEQVLGSEGSGKGLIFEDQYICTGGQFAELLHGHDRWLADLRPLVLSLSNAGLCCHPYDVCTELIAREFGIIITDPFGQQLQAPLDVNTGVAWLGAANQAIYQQVAPLLQEAMRKYKLTD